MASSEKGIDIKGVEFEISNKLHESSSIHSNIVFRALTQYRINLPQIFLVSSSYESLYKFVRRMQLVSPR